MAISSMIIGIISGLFLLGWGVLGYFIGAAAGSGGIEFFSIAAPLAVLVGAGIVPKKHLVGGILMLVGGCSILFIIGLNAIGGYFAIPALVAGGLGIWAEQSAKSIDAVPPPSGGAAGE